MAVIIDESGRPQVIASAEPKQQVLAAEAKPPMVIATGELRGPAGPEGPMGPVGLQGATGPQGPTGQAGYDEAVSLGFVGTKAAWLATLVGPTGPTGPQGPQGDDGAPGDGLIILGTVANNSLLPNTGVAIGSGYIISGDLWVYRGVAQGWFNAGPIVGPQGEQGIQGIQGIQGVQGLVGPQGEVGPQGIQGLTGPEGPASTVPGPIGPAGPQGLQGIQGIQGPAGGIASVAIACSDETTAITVGNGKVIFRMPHGLTLSTVKASLVTAQASGALLTVDVKQNGASILSTLLTFDNGEKTTVTALAPAVISNAALANDAEISIDITQVGTSGAAGLKVYLVGAPA